MTRQIELLYEICCTIEKKTGCTEYLLLREVFLLCQRYEYYPLWFADFCSNLGQAIRTHEDDISYKEEGSVVYSEGIKHCTDESTRQYLESLMMDIIIPVTDPQRIYG